MVNHVFAIKLEVWDDSDLDFLILEAVNLASTVKQPVVFEVGVWKYVVHPGDTGHDVYDKVEYIEGRAHEISN